MSPLRDRLLAGDTHSSAYNAALHWTTASDWPPLLELAKAADPRVREALVATLPLLDDPPQPDWVDAAITLTEDADIGVRDHATFVLGQQWRELDTPAIRTALAARLDDLDRDVRGEALVGLAFRHDERALPRVRDALSRTSGDVWRLELIAAGALGDPSLHPLVLRHLDGWDDARWPEAVRRLTDPGGPGADLFRGVAAMFASGPDGEPDAHAGLSAWQLMLELLDIAPDRAPSFYTATAARLGDDPDARARLAELLDVAAESTRSKTDRAAAPWSDR